MNSKMKIFIILFLSVMSSITAVYAVTIISSKDVIYDNTKSGGSSPNVQGAIDELYGLAESGGGSGGVTSSSRNIVKYITNLAKTDTTNLAYDDTADKNLRYIGSNPNNYVEFNGELWRIIGVMNNAIIEANGGHITDYVSGKTDENGSDIMQRAVESVKRKEEKRPFEKKPFDRNKKSFNKVEKETREEPRVQKEEKTVEPQKAEANEDLADKTVSELRDLAKAKDIKGYSTMKKAELLEALK